MLPADPQPDLILSAALTPRGVVVRPLFRTAGMTAEEAGRLFGSSARGLADHAGRMRAALESAYPGSAAAFDRGYAAAAAAPRGVDRTAIQVAYPPPPESPDGRPLE